MRKPCLQLCFRDLLPSTFQIRAKMKKHPCIALVVLSLSLCGKLTYADFQETRIIAIGHSYSYREYQQEVELNLVNEASTALTKPSFLTDKQAEELIELFVINLSQFKDWYNYLDSLHTIETGENQTAFWTFLLLSLHFWQLALNGQIEKFDSITEKIPQMQAKIVDQFTNNSDMQTIAYDYLQQHPSLMNIDIMALLSLN